jgi:CO dehydrogenase nickel-insertion accessory protein CooC1
LSSDLKERGISVVGSLGYGPEIRRSGLEGHPIESDKAQRAIAQILDELA